MKKIVCMLLAAVMLCGVATGCGSSESLAQPKPQEVADALMDKISFDEELSLLAEDEISIYVEMEDGVEGIMYISSGSTAEEIAVFKAPDKNTATKMVANVKDYLKAQRSSFADYLPEEAKRIDDAVVEQKGNYVVLCVSGQSADAKAVISDVFAN